MLKSQIIASYTVALPTTFGTPQILRSPRQLRYILGRRATIGRILAINPSTGKPSATTLHLARRPLFITVARPPWRLAAGVRDWVLQFLREKDRALASLGS
jgi:hypothetical protein